MSARKYKHSFPAIFVGLFIYVLLEGVHTYKGPIVSQVLVCYIASWEINPQEEGVFTRGNAVPELCTHLVYAYAKLDPLSWTIQSMNPQLDLKANQGWGGYEKATRLKQRYPNLTVTLAVGGSSEDSASYSEMTGDPMKKIAFITSVIQFLKLYNFDGLDLFWLYSASDSGTPSAKENAVTFIKELKKEFEKHQFILTASLSPFKKIISKNYDIASFSKYFDLMHLNCFNYHDSLDSRILPNAPLFGTEQEDLLSVESTVNYILEEGADPNKIVLGVPLFGHNFVKQSPHDAEDIGAVAKIPGSQRPFAAVDALMSYREICTELSNTSSSVAWSQRWHNETKTPYAVNGDRLIVYDNERSIVEKVRFALTKNLAGVMVWSIDMDDYKGDCAPTEGAFQDFDDSIRELKSSPFYEDALYQLPIPNDITFKYFVPDGNYKIKNGKLILDELNKQNFPLLRTLNQAMVVVNQEVAIKMMLEEKIKQKETEARVVTKEVMRRIKKMLQEDATSGGRTFTFTSIYKFYIPTAICFTILRMYTAL